MKMKGLRIVLLLCAVALAVPLMGAPGCQHPYVEITYSISGGFAPRFEDLSIDMEGTAVYEEGFFGEPQFRISEVIPETPHWLLYRLFLMVGFYGFEDAYPWRPGDPTDLPTVEITIADSMLGVRKAVSFYMAPQGRPEGLWTLMEGLDSVVDAVKAANLFEYELQPGSRIYGASCPVCDDWNDEALSGTFTLVKTPSPIPESRLFDLIWLNLRSPNVYTLANNWDEFSRIEADFLQPVASFSADLFVNGIYEEWFTGRGALVEGDVAPEAFSFEEVGCAWVSMDFRAVRVE